MTDDQLRGKDLVSAVVPAVRNDKYVHEAVQSLLADGYPNLEVVVVWDGPESLFEPAWQNEPQIRQVMNGARMGAASAANRGIAESRGAFIARLDADDVSFPGRLSAQVDFLAANPGITLVAAAAVVMDADGAPLGAYPAAGHADVRRELLRRNPIVHSSILVPKAVLADVHGYDPTCTRTEDYDLLLRIACRGPIAILEETYVAYRVHPDQSSNSSGDFWHDVRVVVAGRQALRRHLKTNAVRQCVWDTQWVAAQWAKARGIRRSRLLSRLERGAPEPTTDA